MPSCSLVPSDKAKTAFVLNGQVYWGKLNTDSICVLKYSPCGHFLAAGSHDQHLDIYDVKVCKMISTCTFTTSRCVK